MIAEQVLVDGMLERMAQKVSIIGTSEVSDYLLGHPDMADLLEVTYARAVNRLPNARLTIQLYQDPEIDDRYLVLNVDMESFNEELAELIDRMYADLAAALVSKSGWLQISPSFRA